jgi:Uma2 family endonuclease
MTFQEYLDWEERQEFKHEFVDGYPVPRWAGQHQGMAGASTAHNVIAANVSRMLGNKLAGGPCRALGSDAKVVAKTGRSRYPDVTVQCAPLDLKSPILDAPVLVVEVLSPSNTWFDQSQRLEDYKSIETVRAILFLAQDEPRGELWSRTGEVWARREFGDIRETVEIEAVGAALAMSEIYDGLNFEANA